MYFQMAVFKRKHHLHLLGVLMGCFMVLAPNLWAIPTILYHHGDPTDLEQYMLELINRARANPVAEGQRLEDQRQTCPENFTHWSEEFASYPIAPPLAFNAQLLQAARLHSQDMVQRNYFSHDTPEGLSPSDRVKAQGYSLGAGENIYSGGATTVEGIEGYHAGFMIDCGIPSLGHRLNILFPSYKEVGIGNVVIDDSGRITQDFGAASEQILLLGVVYHDRDGNGFYGPGEGLGGITVMPAEGDYYAVTSASGGYAILFTVLETVDVGAISSTVPVNSSWTQVSPIADAFQQDYRANPANQATLNLTVTFSGGSLSNPSTKNISMVKPVLVNYRINEVSGGVYWPQQFMLGNNVKLDLDTAVSQPPLETPTSVFPTLGQNFNGGIAVNGQAYQAQATLNLSDTVDVSGDIQVDATDVGKTADIVVYAEATLSSSPEKVYFMLGEGLTISMWDQNPATLVAFQRDVTLNTLHSVPMYSGHFIYPGTLKVFFGYRLADGTLVVNSQPIDITILPSIAIFSYPFRTTG